MVGPRGASCSDQSCRKECAGGVRAHVNVPDCISVGLQGAKWGCLVYIGTWGCRWFRKRDGGSAEMVHIIGVALLTGEVLGLSDSCAELIDNQ